jgi:hypothetical protein
MNVMILYNSPLQFPPSNKKESTNPYINKNTSLVFLIKKTKKNRQYDCNHNFCVVKIGLNKHFQSEKIKLRLKKLQIRGRPPNLRERGK